MTARQLAKHIEQRLGIKHVRIAGATDTPISTISCMFGAPGGLMEELKRDVCQALIAGEVCEWSLCEYARDASQLGYTKSVLALGHVGSERAGMVYIADLIKKQFADVEVKYFECEEVYSYSE
jgi:putative NIF3 family GTP cyclohydrolase 1 type 2